jgi:Fe-S-cluster containining protein
MTSSAGIERFHLELKTPAGVLSAEVEASTGFVPIASIVPLVQRLGTETHRLEEQAVIRAGGRISCQKGCAACCRMLVPVSPLEAIALRRELLSLPDERRFHMIEKIAESKRRLEQAGLLARLTDLADSGDALSDEALEPLNRDYYALRMPCPFLENEVCSIYEHRPAACRELLVTSPPELCQDLAHNPVEPIDVSIRVSTVLGLLWSDLTGRAPRLIPLPIAIDWAERHETTAHVLKKGTDLLQQALGTMTRFLQQEFLARTRKQTDSETPPDGRPETG